MKNAKATRSVFAGRVAFGVMANSLVSLLINLYSLLTDKVQ